MSYKYFPVLFYLFVALLFKCEESSLQGETSSKRKRITVEEYLKITNPNYDYEKFFSLKNGKNQELAKYKNRVKELKEISNFLRESNVIEFSGYGDYAKTTNKSILLDMPVKEKSNFLSNLILQDGYLDWSSMFFHWLFLVDEKKAFDTVTECLNQESTHQCLSTALKDNWIQEKNKPQLLALLVRNNDDYRQKQMLFLNYKNLFQTPTEKRILREKIAQNYKKILYYDSQLSNDVFFISNVMDEAFRVGDINHPPQPFLLNFFLDMVIDIEKINPQNDFSSSNDDDNITTTFATGIKWKSLRGIYKIIERLEYLENYSELKKALLLIEKKELLHTEKGTADVAFVKSAVKKRIVFFEKEILKQLEENNHEK